MDRRSFFKFLGLGTVAAVVEPSVLAMKAERPKKRGWFAKLSVKVIEQRPDPLFSTPQELHQWALEQQWKRLTGKPVKLMPKLEPFNPMYCIDDRFKAFPHLHCWVQVCMCSGSAVLPAQTVCVTGRQKPTRGRLQDNA